METKTLTSGQILEEYAKCIMNPIYAIETYFTTFDMTQEGFVKFKLFERQRQIIDAYEKFRHNLVTKPRQAGVSTTTAAYIAVKTGFGDEKNPEKVLILANKRDMAEEFLSKIKDFLVQLPRWVWGDEYYGDDEKEEKSIFVVDSQKKIVLPNGCVIKAVATSKDALRGYTPTYLIMDEAAYIDDGAEVFGAAMTSLGTGGRCTLISTPNSFDPLYHKTYEGAKMGDNNFNIIEMKWYEDNRYNKDLRWLKDDEEIKETKFTFDSYNTFLKDGYRPTSTWYEDMCKSMNNDKRMIARELDVSFVGSGGNVIDDEYIQYHEHHNVCDPKFVSGMQKETWIWSEPIKDHKYVLAADVSSGSGADFSTFTIIDFTTMEQVAEYRCKIAPDLFGKVIYEYATMYDAYVVADVTGGWGQTTMLKLLELKYKNIHYSTTNKILDSTKKLNKYVTEDDKKPGLVVNSIRMALIAHLEQAVRENTIKIRSIRLTSELKTFVYRDGRPDHIKGRHDDLIFSFAMAIWVMEHSFKNLEKAKNQAKAMLAGWTAVGQSASPSDNYRSGYSPRDNKGNPLPKPKFSPQVARNMQDPNGDHLWLFSGYR